MCKEEKLEKNVERKLELTYFSSVTKEDEKLSNWTLS